ncbi:MAG: hypothetical protein WC601_07985, partial [Desulfotomaculaceae bacterium]
QLMMLGLIEGEKVHIDVRKKITAPENIINLLSFDATGGKKAKIISPRPWLKVKVCPRIYAFAPNISSKNGPCIGNERIQVKIKASASAF